MVSLSRKKNMMLSTGLPSRLKPNHKGIAAWITLTQIAHFIPVTSHTFDRTFVNNNPTSFHRIDICGYCNQNMKANLHGLLPLF